MVKKYLVKLINLLAASLNGNLTSNFHVTAQAAILSSRSNYANLKSLSEAELKIYSQWGEDGIFDFFSHTLGIKKPLVLEVGAGEFQECNSRFLVEFRNASATLVDANLNLESRVINSDLYWKTHLFPVVTWVTPSNINEIINYAKQKMKGIDFFSLDLDGNDYWILKAANLTEFKVVVLEYNSIFGFEKCLSVPEDENFDRKLKHYSLLYFGASLPAYVKLMESKGFVFTGSNLVNSNAFFVRNDLAKKITFDLPTNLSEFTDCRIRESRDEFGNMSYLTLNEGISLILNLPIIDLETETESLISEAI